MCARRRKAIEKELAVKDEPSEDDTDLEFGSEDFWDQLPPVTNYLSTGSTLLDLALANRLPGGFPGGRIAQIYGDESTAKTVIGSEALGSAQRQNGWACIDDVERTWDFGRAELYGVDTKNKKQWDYKASRTIEKLFDDSIASAIDAANDAEGPGALVVDTLSALPSEAEEEAKMTDGTYGTSRAKQVGLGFRKYLQDIGDCGLAVIFIDQTRERVGVTFGEKSTTSGGKALRFYASTRIKLSHDSRIKNKYEKIVGVKIGFFVRKNKVAPPFRDGTIRILFDYGIDDIASSLEWLHENDPDLLKEHKTKRGRPWVFKDLKGRGLDDLTHKVEKEGLETELQKDVERVWRVVHQPIVRKKRVRLN